MTTTEARCQVPGCHKVALCPTNWEPQDKLACLSHWEEFEQWKTDRGI